MTEIRKANGSGDGAVRPRHAAGNPENKPVRVQTTVRRTASAQVNTRAASPAARPAANAARRPAASGASVQTRSASTAVRRTTASAPSSAASRTRVNPKAAPSSAKTARAPQKKKTANGGFPIVSRIRELIPKNVNWPLILVIAISVLILIGIITLMSIGISRCAGGCSEGGPNTA